MPFAPQNRRFAILWQEPIKSPYWMSVAQTTITGPHIYDGTRIALQSAHADVMLVTTCWSYLKAVYPGCKIQGEEQTPTYSLGIRSLSSASQEIITKTDESSIDSSSGSNEGLEQSLSCYLLPPDHRMRVPSRRSPLFGIRMAIVMVFAINLALAHPLIPRTALPTLAAAVLNPEGTKQEQVSQPDPYTWVTFSCFIMVLIGFAWTAWVCSRGWTLEQCRHSLVLSGLLSLAVSVAWTAILYTVDASQSPRYLALGCWSMFIISFIGESYQYLQKSRQYAFMVVPTFLLALHLTLFLVNQHIWPEKSQVWDLRRFYENAPLAFTLWAILLCWIYQQWAPDDSSSEGVGDDINLDDLLAPGEGGGHGSNPGDSLTSSGGDGNDNHPGGLPAFSEAVC